MIVPDPNYRPNALRAVYVQGRIDQQMADRLTPQIIKLQAASRNPITVFIDSRGGDVAIGELILKLLNASNQDSAPPCQIITVVTHRASSAAADLLSAGDYSIAFPESMSFYHGVRQSLVDPVTVEYGSALTDSLRVSNDQSAMALARKTEWRFMFRFVMLQAKFPGVRKELAKPTMTDLDCLLHLLSGKLSARAAKLLARARERHERYNALLDKCLVKAFQAKKSLMKAPLPPGRLQAEVIHKIIDFELSSHKKDPSWTFYGGGFSRVTEDFFLLQEYLVSAHSPQFQNLCQRWGPYVLTVEEKTALIAISDEAARDEAMLDKVRPHFQPLWSFFVALCHALQESEENYLTPCDAFWLGLIDEVIGEDLPSQRLIAEFRPDPQPTKGPASTTEPPAA